MITAIVIPADPAAPVRREQLTPGDDWGDLVAGMMQVITFEEPLASLYLNEEGKVAGLPFNARATAMTWVHNSAFRGRDQIVGDAFLVGPVDDDGDDLSVPEEYVRVLFEARALRVEVQCGDDTRWCPLGGLLTATPSAYLLAADFAHHTPAVAEIRLVAVDGPAREPMRSREALGAAFQAARGFAAVRAASEVPDSPPPVR